MNQLTFRNAPVVSAGPEDPTSEFALREVVAQYAFTLIELLAVVAIITVLAGITLPLFNLVQQRSDSAQCISNLRQLTIAATAAATDNGGRYPNMRADWYNDPGPVKGDCFWLPGDPSWDATSAGNACDVLAPYLGSIGMVVQNGSQKGDVQKVWRCPAARRNTVPDHQWMKDADRSSYRYNWYAPNRLPFHGALNAMVFMDCVYQNWKSSTYSHAPGTGAFINVSYADGHIAVLSYASVQALCQSGNWDATNDLFLQGWCEDVKVSNP